MSTEYIYRCDCCEEKVSDESSFFKNRIHKFREYKFKFRIIIRKKKKSKA